MKLRINLIIILVALSGAGILAFQVTWLNKSYKLSHDKIVYDANRAFDNSILEYRDQKADKVRILLKKLVIPQDLDYLGQSYPSRSTVNFKSNSQSSYYAYEVEDAELSKAARDPYHYLLGIIAKENLSELENIYSAILGNKAPETTLYGGLLNELRKEFELYQNTIILEEILTEKFNKEGLTLKGKIKFYSDFIEIYRPQIPTSRKTITEKHPAVSMSVLAGSSIKSLASRLEELNKFVKIHNDMTGQLYIAKPLLDDIDDIMMNRIPGLMFVGNLSDLSIIDGMKAGLISSLLLIILTGSCMFYLFATVMKQKRLSEMKNDFISNISHELNTPLATTLAAVQSILHFDVLDDKPKTRRYLSTVETEIKRLSQIITKVLDSTIFDMKGFSLSPINFNLKSALSDLINAVQSHSSKDIKVNLNYEGTEEIFADKIHLQNVLINLLDNAVKYGRHNVEVEIVCKRLADKLIIYVADNGPGIPQEHQKEIFDQFFRVQNESSMAIKGHGIGLNYVKKIIEMHRGVVSVFKSDGTGTTMEIILPQ